MRELRDCDADRADCDAGQDNVCCGGSNPLNSQLIVAINTTANAFFTPHCPLEHVMGWGNNRCQCHGSTGNGQWCGAALGRLMPFDGCFVLLQRVVVVEQECVLWFRCS
eukprot:168739_1